jgi:hypothetical protein
MCDGCMQKNRTEIQTIEATTHEERGLPQDDVLHCTNCQIVLEMGNRNTWDDEPYCRKCAEYVRNNGVQRAIATAGAPLRPRMRGRRRPVSISKAIRCEVYQEVKSKYFWVEALRTVLCRLCRGQHRNGKLHVPVP